MLGRCIRAFPSEAVMLAERARYWRGVLLPGVRRLHVPNFEKLGRAPSHHCFATRHHRHRHHRHVFILSHIEPSPSPYRARHNSGRREGKRMRLVLFILFCLWLQPLNSCVHHIIRFPSQASSLSTDLYKTQEPWCATTSAKSLRTFGT